MTEPLKSYKPPKVSRNPLSAVIITIIAVLSMFVILPFTQFLTAVGPKDSTIRSFEVNLPPPPPPPPEPPPPEQEPEPDEQPEMEPPPSLLSLSQLETAINPGVGSALVGDFSLGDNLGMAADDTLDQIDMFDISDLDEVPRRTREGQMRWPPDLQRNRVEGFVHLEGKINPDGSVEYLKTVEASHPQYERAVITYMSGLRYTPPRRNGQPVSARLILKLPITYAN